MQTKGKYILDADGNPQEETDLIKWATWYETADRVLAHDDLANEICVATLFLGVNFNFAPLGPPLLWETTVSDTKGRRLEQRPALVRLLDEQNVSMRYATREQAMAGHARMVSLANGWMEE
jgi:hypothetical protein